MPAEPGSGAAGAIQDGVYRGGGWGNGLNDGVYRGGAGSGIKLVANSDSPVEEHPELLPHLPHFSNHPLPGEPRRISGRDGLWTQYSYNGPVDHTPDRGGGRYFLPRSVSPVPVEVFRSPQAGFFTLPVPADKAARDWLANRAGRDAQAAELAGQLRRETGQEMEMLHGEQWHQWEIEVQENIDGAARDSGTPMPDVEIARFIGFCVAATLGRRTPSDQQFWISVHWLQKYFPDTYDAFQFVKYLRQNLRFHD